jgi:hypothetical protein
MPSKKKVLWVRDQIYSSEANYKLQTFAVEWRTENREPGTENWELGTEY